MKRDRLEKVASATRTLSLLIVAFLSVAGFRQLWEQRQQEPTEKVSLASLGAEVLFIDASAIVKRGPTRAVVVRFAEPVELVPYHFRSAGLEAPAPADAWAKHLGAPLVFNAGQFDENLEHLGWLKSDGRWIVSQRKLAWKGLLVSGPEDGAAWARIVDLDLADGIVVERYKHVIQSMMLVDAESKVRVRDTELTASRTVVGEDKRGRILVIVIEGATTLGDLARWLPTTSLGIVRAMNLDGGIESQLVIDTPELRLGLYGQYGTGTTVWNSAGGQMRYPLPVIVAVRPQATLKTAPSPSP